LIGLGLILLVSSITIVFALTTAAPTASTSTSTLSLGHFDTGLFAAKYPEEAVLALFDHFDIDLVASGSEMEQGLADGFFDRRAFADDRVHFFAHVV